jgi:hypothetical protein
MQIFRSLLSVDTTTQKMPPRRRLFRGIRFLAVLCALVMVCFPLWYPQSTIDDISLDNAITVIFDGFFAGASVFLTGDGAPSVFAHWRSSPRRPGSPSLVTLEGSSRKAVQVDWVFIIVTHELSEDAHVMVNSSKRGTVHLFVPGAYGIDSAASRLESFGYVRDKCSERWILRNTVSARPEPASDVEAMFTSVLIHRNPAYNPLVKEVDPIEMDYSRDRDALVGQPQQETLVSPKTAHALSDSATNRRLGAKMLNPLVSPVPVYVVTSSLQRRALLDPYLSIYSAWLSPIKWVQAVRPDDICEGRGFRRLAEEKPAVLSCISSHALAARHIYNDGVEAGLVLEDDVRLRIGAGADLVAVRDWAVSLARRSSTNYSNGEPALVSVAYFPDERLPHIERLPRREPGSIDVVSRFDVPPWGTQGFLLTRASAASILGTLFRPTLQDMRLSLGLRGHSVPLIADQALFRITVRHVVRPPLAIDGGVGSVIGTVPAVGAEPETKDAKQEARVSYQQCLLTISQHYGLLNLSEYDGIGWSRSPNPALLLEVEKSLHRCS